MVVSPWVLSIKIFLIICKSNKDSYQGHYIASASLLREEESREVSTGHGARNDWSTVLFYPTYNPKWFVDWSVNLIGL